MKARGEGAMNRRVFPTVVRDCIRVTLPMLIAASCSGASQGQGADRTAVQKALEAQLSSKLGGCGAPERIDTTEVAFFPGVTLYRGSCLAEHGDVRIGNFVGTDQEGLIYLLDSPSGFEFLRRRHLPAAISQENAVEYCRLAAVFSGAVEATARLISKVTDLPDSVRLRLPTVLLESGGSRVVRAAGSTWLVRLWFLSELMLVEQEVAVTHRTGRVTVGPRTVHWESIQIR
jgi:hypothetical protein